MAASDVVLYTYWRSSCSWRARIALQWKGVPYESRFVNLVANGGQQHSSDYIDVNPQKLIPTLLIDGCKLSQSLAILEYLEETRPSAGLGRLLPSDDFALRAKIRQVCCIICSDTQPIQNLRVLQRVAALTEGDAKAKEDAKTEWARSWIAAGLAAVEAVIAATAGKCCFGDAVTLADICLVPQVYNAVRFGVDMTQLPTVVRVNEYLASLQEFVAAHPQQQGDAPPGS